MSEHHMRMRVNGSDLAVSMSGTGPPVLLIPGGGGSSDYLGPLARQIDRLNTVYRIEPRGCGRSAHDGRYDLATTMADFDGIRDQLGIERWVVGGHSHGAFLALAYAIQQPKRVAGVLYLAGTGLQNDRSWHEAYDAGLERGLDRDVPAGTFTWNSQCNAVANADYKEYVRRPNLWRDVSRLPMPLRAVNGGRDIRPAWPVEQLVAAAPDALLRTIPEAPHDLWYTHTARLGAILRDHLNELA